MQRRWNLDWCLGIAVSSFAAWLVWDLARHSGRYGWDFHVYYDAASMWAQRLDPYDAQARSEFIGRTSPLAYVYPPSTLALFRPLNALPYAYAYLAWLALKLVALLALLRLHRREIAPLPSLWATVGLLVFAFDASLYADFATGNISVFEQLGLWTALAALLQGRYFAFAVLVGLVAQFKVTPLVFLALLPLIPDARGWRKALGAGLFTFGALFATNWFEPQLMPSFLGGARLFQERGRLNPSTLGVAKSLVQAFRDDAPALWNQVAYGFMVVLVAAITVSCARRLGGSLPERRLLVLLFTAAYALAMPRMKVYSFLVLLPATLFLARESGTASRMALVGLVALPRRGSMLPVDLRPLDEYSAWLGAVLVFGLLVSMIRSRTPHESPPIPAPLPLASGA